MCKFRGQSLHSAYIKVVFCIKFKCCNCTAITKPFSIAVYFIVIICRIDCARSRHKHLAGTWHCSDHVSSCNIYICSPTRYTKCFNEWVLFSTYVGSTCFGPHRSIIRSVLHKLYSQTLVCGNTRSTHSSTSYQSLQIQLVQNAPDDGPMRSKICRANISAE